MTEEEPGPGRDDASDASEALSLVKELRELVGAILERLTEAVRYGKRTRKISWGIGLLGALDITLSVITVAVLFNQAHVEGQLHQQQAVIRQSQLRACGIGNDFRAGQRQLWNHVIAVSSAPPGETRAEREARLAKLAAFRAYIGRQFRAVSCTALYGKP